MILLLLGIALAAAVPDSPAARREAAEALLGSPATLRSGIEGLVALRDDPAEGPAARTSLVSALAELPPSPGLRSVYEVLIPSDPTGRMRALAAELSLGDPARRAAATAELDRLAASPGATLLVGRIWLRAGDLPRARAALSRPGSGGAALLSLLDDAGDPVRALIAAGYPRAAVALVDDGTPEGARAGARLAVTTRLPAEAEARWRVVLAAAPGDDEATVGLARALADQGRVGAARSALGDADAGLLAILDARLQIAGAARTPDPADDLAAAAAAWEVAPGDPRVASAWGAARLAAGDADAALGPLALALDALPADPALVERFTRAATSLGRPDLAVPRLRAALASAATPGDRRAFTRQLAGLLVTAGESAKAAGDLDAALTALAEAVLLAPTDPGALASAAGAVWAHGDPHAAWRLYTQAARRAPQDPTIRAALTSLAPLVGEAAPTATGSTPPPPTHAQGDALLAAGRPEEALVAYRAAVDQDPGDAWAILGQASALLALDRPEAARAVLVAALPPDLPDDAAAARARLLAESHRLDGERLRAEGADADAIAAYGRALTLRDDPWALSAASALYLAHAQPDLALAFAEAAAARAPDEPEHQRAVARAQEALGRDADARATLERVAARTGLPADAAALHAFSLRRTLARAEALRLAGDPDAARALLEPLLAEPDPDVWGALAAARLDAGDPAGALDAGIRGVALATTLARDGGPDRSRWATALALDAARRAAASARLLPHLAALADAAPAAAPALADAHLDAALQAALALADRPRAAAAQAAVEAATALADDPADLTRIGDAWLALGRADRATAALEASLAAAENPAARLSLARAHLQEGRLADARASLAAVRPVPPTAAAPAPLPALPLPSPIRARAPGSSRLFSASEAPLSSAPGRQGAPSLPPPSPDANKVARSNAAEDRAVRSGSGSPPLAAIPPAPALTLPPALEARRRELADELELATAPSVVVTGGVMRRAGTSGESELLALVAPVRASAPPIGRTTLDVAAVPTRLDDGVHQDAGVAASAGLTVRVSAPVTAAARLGVSPLGFLGGAYPTWTGGVDWSRAPGVALRLSTGRSPVTQSLASWAGSVDPTTGQTWGRLSRLWLQGEATGRPGRGWDDGLRVSGGWMEGIGVDPDPYGDALGWAGHAITPVLRLGGQAYVQSTARRIDAFEAGSGGTFSPPFFGLAQLRADLDAPLGAGRVCAGVAGGGQLIEGGEQLGVDTGGVGGARLAVGWPLGRWWTLDLDASVEATTGGWHRETTLLDVRWGRPPAAAGDVAFPGSTVPGALFSSPPCLPRSP